MKQLRQKDPLKKFLMQIPPDFDKAEIHGVRLIIINISLVSQLSRQPREDELWS